MLTRRHVSDFNKLGLIQQITLRCLGFINPVGCRVSTVHQEADHILADAFIIFIGQFSPDCVRDLCLCSVDNLHQFEFCPGQMLCLNVLVSFFKFNFRIQRDILSGNPDLICTGNGELVPLYIVDRHSICDFRIIHQELAETVGGIGRFCDVIVAALRESSRKQFACFGLAQRNRLNGLHGGAVRTQRAEKELSRPVKVLREVILSKDLFNPCTGLLAVLCCDCHCSILRIRDIHRRCCDGNIHAAGYSNPPLVLATDNFIAIRYFGFNEYIYARQLVIQLDFTVCICYVFTEVFPDGSYTKAVRILDRIVSFCDIKQLAIHMEFGSGQFLAAVLNILLDQLQVDQQRVNDCDGRICCGVIIRNNRTVIIVIPSMVFGRNDITKPGAFAVSKGIQ